MTTLITAAKETSAKGTKKFFDEQIVSYLSVWKDDFSQMICPSRRTSRRQYNINSHQTVKCQTICSSSCVKTAIVTTDKRVLQREEPRTAMTTFRLI